jgi:hypothetical protein
VDGEAADKGPGIEVHEEEEAPSKKMFATIAMSQGIGRLNARIQRLAKRERSERDGALCVGRRGISELTVLQIVAKEGEEVSLGGEEGDPFLGLRL